MRAENVFTNLTCNQNCTYCTSRRAVEDRGFVRAAAVRARIDAALAAGARELVLTGGEPALRADLPALVSHARARGAEVVVLETNATLIDPPRAAALRAAGLDLARVNLAGGSAALDAATRDPGGFARTLDGVRALHAAGVPVEVAAAVVRSTRGLLPGLPAALARALPAGPLVRALVLAVPVASPDPDELVPYDAAVETVLAVDAAARAVGLPVRLRGDAAPPPCVFPLGPRTAHLFSLTAGGAARADTARLPPCAECQVADRCPGISRAYLARHAPPAMRPVTEDRVRRRLSLVASVEAQIAREFVAHDRSRSRDGAPVDEAIIRVNFHCNQACRFCFVSTHLPPAGDAAVRDAIVAAGARGAKVVLSGGEPTLNPALGEYISLARAHSPHPVNLQTNATRLDDPVLLRKLVAAGLTEAFVSLHGTTAEVSDAVTEAPGTFERTVAGLDALAQTAVHVTLNFVICQRNLADLAPYVRMVAARWPRAWVNVSFVAGSTDVVPRDRALIPRYTDVLPHLAAALAEATRLGVTVVGFESMCGVPLCLVPTELARHLELSGIPEGLDRGEFVRAPACHGCGLASRCFGLRRGYAELYGPDELRRIDPPPAPPAVP